MSRSLRLILLAVLAALVAGLALVPSAGATDSHAPRGARADWLPMDEWIMSGWLPFDEARLERVLHVSRSDLAAYLDDRRSLMELAMRKGVAHDAHGLAVRLVATRHVGPALRRTLDRRAEDVLTQAHLSRHVLFHLFHTHALTTSTRTVFGMPASRYAALRDRGLSPVGIAKRGGRSHAQLVASLRAFFVARAHRSVAIGAASGAQARRQLAHQEAELETFVTRRYRTPAQQAAYAAARHHDGHAEHDMAGMP